MSLPRLVANTFPKRQRKFLKAFDAGAVDIGRHLPSGGHRCYFCRRKEGHGLNLLRLPDGTTLKVGPECLKAFEGLDHGNVAPLRAMLRATPAARN